jgi:hypothetical protein
VPYQLTAALIITLSRSGQDAGTPQADRAPVAGHLTSGVGDFFSPDTHQRTPVLIRCRWSDITAPTARRARAFSADDGLTWETNWTADFTRPGAVNWAIGFFQRPGVVCWKGDFRDARA